MQVHDRIGPYVAVSVVVHLIATGIYAFSFQSKPISIPRTPMVQQVNLVEWEAPKQTPDPVVQETPAEEPEIVEPEVEAEPDETPVPEETKPVERIPETIRPQEEKKDPPEEEKKPEKKPEPVKPKPVKPEVRKEPVKETPVQPAVTASGPVSVEIENFAFSYYLAIIESKVGGRWSPPRGIVGGERPHVIIRFDVMHDGRIAGAEITRSSGISFFDISAMRAVQDANPLPPLPKGYEDDRLQVNYIFRYEG
ncbi:MAG: TonB family protein [Gemmatimonadetes bacterium]|nr:TonB family protein [Gemmatimonadota bacterium]